MSKENPIQRTEISQELKTQMMAAATYEELAACWESLAAEQNFGDEITSRGLKSTPEESVMSQLQNTRLIFTRSPYACDSAIKTIFEDQHMSSVLERMGIPQEFLLQTVRIGAIKSLLVDAERARHRPVTLFADGTMTREISAAMYSGKLDDPEKEQERLKQIVLQTLASPTLDGISWANTHLANIQKEKKEAQQKEKQEQELKKELAKTDLVARIQQNMRVPGFRLDVEQKNMLRDNFAGRLAFWKSFLENSVGRNAADNFFKEHANDEITVETFTMFKDMLSKDAGVAENYNDDERLGRALEILNPESGWFYVLIANKKRTWGEFKEASHSNFDQNFEVRL